MKKIYQVATAGLLLLAAAAPPASAKLLLTENFDYPAGNLLGNGGWLQYMTRTSDPHPTYRIATRLRRVSESNRTGCQPNPRFVFERMRILSLG